MALSCAAAVPANPATSIAPSEKAANVPPNKPAPNKPVPDRNVPDRARTPKSLFIDYPRKSRIRLTLQSKTLYRAPSWVESTSTVARLAAAAGRPAVRGMDWFTKAPPCFAAALNGKFHNRR